MLNNYTELKEKYLFKGFIQHEFSTNHKMSLYLQIMWIDVIK